MWMQFFCYHLRQWGENRFYTIVFILYIYYDMFTSIMPFLFYLKGHEMYLLSVLSHSPRKMERSSLSHVSWFMFSLCCSLGLLGGEIVMVTEDQQAMRMLSSLLKGVFVTQRHLREVVISGKVGVWLQSLFCSNWREPFPTLNIRYSWAWGSKACDGLQKYIKCLILSPCQGETLLCSWKGEEKENAFPKKTPKQNKKRKTPAFVFSVTHIVQN